MAHGKHAVKANYYFCFLNPMFMVRLVQRSHSTEEYAFRNVCSYCFAQQFVLHYGHYA